MVGEPQIIPLNECVLCVDCERITNTRTGRCLCCESTAVFNISTILKTAPRVPLEAIKLVPRGVSRKVRDQIAAWSFRPAGKQVANVGS